MADGQLFGDPGHSRDRPGSAAEQRRAQGVLRMTLADLDPITVLLWSGVFVGLAILAVIAAAE